MRGSKYIPNTTFHTQSEQETPVRRRNHSMDNKVQETQSQPLVVPLASYKGEYVPVTTYRKHRVQAKIEKLKNLKGITKLCQENLNVYNTLKKEVTSKQINVVLPVTNRPTDPKLYVRDIGIVPVVKQGMSKKFRTHLKLKCKTDTSNERNSYDPACERKSSEGGQSKVEKLMAGRAFGIKLKGELFPVCGSLSKKYNQLSLREIVQVQQQLPAGYDMFMKISQLRKRKNSVKYNNSRRSSDDYSLNGW